MRKQLSLLSLVAAIVVMTAIGVASSAPKPIGTAVIAAKSEDQIGGFMAITLPENMSERQSKLLKMAYDIAKEDGHKNPEVLQGIILQETHAGTLKSYKVANPGPNAYFGIAQLKVAAARDVLGRWPDLYETFGFHTKTDDEIKAYLILNDVFNLTIASRYLKILQDYGFRGAALIRAYNKGPGAAKQLNPGSAETDPYVVGAKSKLNQIKL